MWCQEQSETSHLPMPVWLLPLLPHWCCFCVWAQLRLKCESSEASGLQNMSHNQTRLMNISEHFFCQEEEHLKSCCCLQLNFLLTIRLVFCHSRRLIEWLQHYSVGLWDILCHLIVIWNSVLLFPHAKTVVSSDQTQRIYILIQIFFDEWALASFVSTNSSFLLYSIKNKPSNGPLSSCFWIWLSVTLNVNVYLFLTCQHAIRNSQLQKRLLLKHKCEMM